MHTYATRWLSGFAEHLPFTAGGGYASGPVDDDLADRLADAS
jgi:hypothetical protein